MEHTIASLLADIPVGAAIKYARQLGVLRFLLSMGGTPLLGKLLLGDPVGFFRLIRALIQVSGKQDAVDFSRSTKQLGASVRLRLKSGQVFEQSVTVPRGFAGSCDWRSLRSLAREKYCEQAAPVIGKTSALQAAALIDNLDKLEPKDVKRLVEINCEEHRPV
jgi:hypothetical protein